MAEAKHWARIAEAGAPLGMALLVAAYRLGGRGLFKVLLLPVVAYFFLFNWRARQASSDYLHRLARFAPEAGVRPGPLASFRHLWQFSLCLLDKLAVWMGHVGQADVDLHGRRFIDELEAKGQGALLLVSHLGNFEITRALSHRYHGMRLTILVHTKHAANFNRFLQRYDQDSLIELLQVSEITPATAMRLHRKAAAGELIAIAADRIPLGGAGQTATVSFLGAEAQLPVGPYLLGALLEAPLFCLFCIKEGGRHQIHFEPFAERVLAPRGRRQAVFAQLAQEYAGRLERFCTRAPLQWFNFYRFWDQGR